MQCIIYCEIYQTAQLPRAVVQACMQLHDGAWASAQQATSVGLKALGPAVCDPCQQLLAGEGQNDVPPLCLREATPAADLSGNGAVPWGTSTRQNPGYRCMQCK
jgi:hypothetical protein